MHTNLGNLLRLRERYEEALVQQERSMVDPSWENYSLRGAIHQRLGNTDLAKADYKKARRMQRDKSELAERYDELGVDPGSL